MFVIVIYNNSIIGYFSFRILLPVDWDWYLQGLAMSPLHLACLLSPKLKKILGYQLHKDQEAPTMRCHLWSQATTLEPIERKCFHILVVLLIIFELVVLFCYDSVEGWSWNLSDSSTWFGVPLIVLNYLIISLNEVIFCGWLVPWFHSA